MKRGKSLRMRLDGEVTVRRLIPPQLRTTASIRKGELMEPIENIAERIGVQTESIEGLVDAQGLTIFGKLQDGIEVFLAGSIAPCVSDSNSNINHNKSNMNTNENSCQKFSQQPPDVSVGWAYDARMLLHVPPLDRVPETPYRLQRAVESLRSTPRAMELLPEELRRLGEVDTTTKTKADSIKKTHNVFASYWLPPRLATLDEITLCHDAERYREFIEHGTPLAPPLKTDVYCNDGTSSVATRLSVAAVIDAARRALQGSPPFSMCLVRPPGHHCTATTPGGFCLANNVAIAARQLLQDWRNENKKNMSCGGGVKSSCSPPPRIAIVDLDVHHGEGTQSFVEEEPPADGCSVSPLLYLSLHRYDHGTFYPRDPRGSTDYVGRHRNVCNVAVHTAAADPARCVEVVSDDVFARVVDDVFVPRLREFRPDVVLLSLGFDAAYGDPLGRMAVEGGFAYAVRALKLFCQERQEKQQKQKEEKQTPVGLVVVLEGGYSPEAVAQGVVAAAHALRFPANDADVLRYAERQVPKTWRGLRRRLARKNVEIQQQHEEEKRRESKKSDMRGEKKAMGNMSSSSSLRSRQEQEEEKHELLELPEDEVLLERHLHWCDRLIARVLAIHTEANRKQ
ncbi:putative histone deacetylase [Trypanosoma theileri]|uniref:histone deacetylase n=1 Tax=Trypanosoma theileri TaxID=67003 RepID=A0A1X0NP71_9TRYP|nr:putative histone deacetylase [Trypanosoma theileri]ORC86495.1 putative histone deacetylase [Trypanosoma theileri]